jgi:predicted DNA-binding transcriptional regulator AlpA
MQAYADPYDRDDALIEQFLGTRYIGRPYVRFAELIDLGVVDNRATLALWIEAGAFPRPIKLAGPTGKSLRWVAVEIARLIATRCAERDLNETTSNEKGVPVQGRPFDSNSSPPPADPRVLSQCKIAASPP